MIKKILVAFICCFVGFNCFADISDKISPTIKTKRIPFPREMVETVIKEDPEYKDKPDVVLAMMDVYDRYAPGNQYKFSVNEAYQICIAGGMKLNSACWNRLISPVLTRMKKFYLLDSCNDTAFGGNIHCVNNVFVKSDSNPYSQDVNVPEYTAYGFAFEYAKRNGHDVWCGANNSDHRIQCGTLDNKDFYIFNFHGKHNTDDKTIEENVVKGICAMQNAEFISSGFKGITANNHLGLDINIEDTNGCLTKCDNDLLKKFSLGGQTWRRGFDWKKDNRFYDFCAIKSDWFFNDLIHRYPGYEYMTDAFANVQFVLDVDLIKSIKTYIELQGIEIESFDCKYKPVPADTWGSSDNDFIQTGLTAMSMINDHPDDALSCELNGKKVDFLFDDLYESGDADRKAGAAGVSCVLASGKYSSDGNCRNLTRQQCSEANSKIPGGTRWDSSAEVCVLNNVAAAKTLKNTIQIAGGVVLAVGVTVLSGGTAVVAIVAVVGSVAFDAAFIGLERLNELQPAHRARSFANDAQACNIPVGTISCTSEQKRCAVRVVNDHFARLNEILDDLNDDQMNLIGDLMENVTGCLSDEELMEAMKTSTPQFEDKLLSNAGIGLMLFGVFFSPETAFAKLAQRSPKIAKVLSRGRVVKTTSSTLNGAEYTRIYVDKLDNTRISSIIDELQKEGLSVSANMTKKGQKFLGVSKQRVFDKWDNVASNWLKSESDKINGILSNFGKKSTKQGGGQSVRSGGKQLDVSYYSIGINEGDDVNAIIKAFEDNGYYVSAGIGNSGERYLAVSADEAGLRYGDVIYKRQNWVKNPSILTGNKINSALTDFGNGFKVSNKRFSWAIAQEQVESLMKEGYYAKLVPTKGVSRGEEYVVVAIKQEDAKDFLWTEGYLIKQRDNSAFIRNLENYTGKEITRIGNTPVFIEESGAIGGRGIVMVRAGEKKIPFYASTGTAGKTDVPTGEWEVFWGIGSDGWFNKGDLDEILDDYGSLELKQIADALDSKLGDPRNVEFVLETVGRNSQGGTGIVGTTNNIGNISENVVNSGLKRAPGTSTNSWMMYENIQDITEYLKGLH